MVDYIGSKAKLLDFIFGRIGEAATDGARKPRFLDVCAGSGRVSQEAARRGFEVYANDLLRLSECLLKGSIGVSLVTVENAETHVERMNRSEGRSGFFHRHYSPCGGRMYFTEENARKIDFCRKYVDDNTEGELRDYLLYCSLVALSRVQNTSGHQTSYLKRFKERALKPFLVRREQVSPGTVHVVVGDAFEAMRKGRVPEVDVAYMDPPYNGRQYGHNYHLYETFVRNDRPRLHGLTGLRDWQKDTRSDFCSTRRCLDFLKDVVSMMPSRKVFISYSSDGIMSRDDIEEGLSSLGCCRDVVVHRTLQRRFKHRAQVGNLSSLYEYLFEVRKI